jgi:hypothetical protein
MTTTWRKSTFSGDNASCVKIRFDGPHVLLGDTKNAHLGEAEPVLRVPAAAWNHTVLHLRGA